jgi:hypothetical protein
MPFECHLNVIMRGKILRKMLHKVLRKILRKMLHKILRKILRKMLHKILRKMKDENLRKFFLKESCGTSIAINSQLGFALSEQCFQKKLR